MCKESPPSRKLNESIDEMNPFKLENMKNVVEFEKNNEENEKKLQDFLERKKFSLKA